ncbi:hypothetical protein GCM10007941_40290 [Amphritea balenae]|nr:hypothetical protein GCM10007941_40290 [Amphritea balenae]
MMQGDNLTLTEANHWDRVKTLKLTCVDGLRFSQRTDKGQVWWLIQKNSSDLQYRIDDLSYRMLQQLDGHITPLEIWQDTDTEITSEQLAAQFVQLLELGFLLPGSGSGSGPGQKTATQKAKKKRLLNPVGFNLFSFNPEFILKPLAPLCRYLFNAGFGMLWCVFIFCGLLLWLNNHDDLVSYFNARAGDPLYILLFWLVYPVLKLIHELGHGLAVWFGGGQVKRAGILMLVFMPVPFVDASESSHFQSKKLRMLVSAAGVMAEMLVAAIGLMFWYFSDSVLLQEIGFIVALAGSVSTIVFNANPLLRFDGYYFLSDWIDVPNLASRSQQLVRRFFFSQIFKLRNSKDVFTCQAYEKKWLVLYGPAALCYRLFIIGVIAYLVSGYFLWLGLLLAAWAIGIQLIWPVATFLKEVWQAAVVQQRIQRFTGVTISALSLSVLMLVIPVRTTVIAEAVVVLPETAYLRTSVDGFVRSMSLSSGAGVNPGDVVMLLDNPELIAQRDKLSAELKKTYNLHASVLLDDPQRATIIEEQISSLTTELNYLEAQVEGLAVTAAQAGKLTIDNWQDLPGRYLKKGELVGFIYQPGHFELQTVVSVADADALSKGELSAEVSFSGFQGIEIPAENIRSVPQAVSYLPDAVLGSAHGGELMIDIQDTSGIKTLYPVFQFNLEIPISYTELVQEERVPAKTAIVKFSHAPRSLASELWALGREFWFIKSI